MIDIVVISSPEYFNQGGVTFTSLHRDSGQKIYPEIRCVLNGMNYLISNAKAKVLFDSPSRFTSALIG
jgi:hypothetical protein